MELSNAISLSLTGKTAIVTGSLGFLGKYFCAGLAQAGANLVADSA